MDKRIRDEFDKVAEKYDSQRKYLVPCLDDFYEIAVELLELSNKCPKILDLGAGTGLFTSHIYKKYVNGDYTLIDLSSDMLKIAKERFINLNNFKYVNNNYILYDYKEKYDAIVSSLSIHHLSNEDKQLLFKKSYENLKEGGIFINADQILGSYIETEEINRKNWVKRIEKSPLNETDKKSAYARMKLDKMTTLNENIEMIKKGGFCTVDIYYKFYNFAVICATK